jgi:hypothetical protein
VSFLLSLLLFVVAAANHCRTLDSGYGGTRQKLRCWNSRSSSREPTSTGGLHDE